MAVTPTTVIGKGQFYWEKTKPRELYLGNGTDQLQDLPNLLDREDILDVIEALNATTLYMSGAADAKTIAAALAEIQAMVTGTRLAIVFDTKEQLDDWLAGTYTRPDSVLPTDLQVGENIYIKDVDADDYWWDGTTIQVLNEKTDLTDYSTTTEMDAAIATAVAAAINALPAYARTAPPNDGAVHGLLNGAWVKTVLGADDTV